MVSLFHQHKSHKHNKQTREGSDDGAAGTSRKVERSSCRRSQLTCEQLDDAACERRRQKTTPLSATSFAVLWRASSQSVSQSACGRLTSGFLLGSSAAFRSQASRFRSEEFARALLMDAPAEHDDAGAGARTTFQINCDIILHAQAESRLVSGGGAVSGAQEAPFCPVGAAPASSVKAH